MKKVEAYKTTHGTLFEKREDYVRAEIEETLGAFPETFKPGFVDAILDNREMLVNVLHEPKKRGPNKPKVAAKAA